MATQLFWRGSTSQLGDLKSHGLGLQLDPNFWDASVARCYWAEDYAFTTARGGAADFGTYTAVAGPTVTKLAQSNATHPITSAFTMSGTITFNMWGRQSVDSNAGFVMRVMRYNAATDALELVVEQAKGTELATSATTSTANNWTASGYSAVAFAPGDHILVFVGFDDAGGNMIAGGTLRHDFDGPTPGAVGDSYVTFTEDFAFDTSAPAGTTLYLRNSASDIVDQGSTINEKALSTSRGAASTTGVVNAVTGPTAGIKMTVTAGGNELEWYSGRIGPVTLSGPALVNLRGLQSNVASNGGLRVELHRVEDDGTGAVWWCGGLLVRSGFQGSLATSTQAHSAKVMGAPLGFVGHRLRLRVFADESYTQVWQHMAASGTVTLQFDGPTGGAAGDSFITFTETITDYTAPGPVTQPYAIRPAQVI